MATKDVYVRNRDGVVSTGVFDGKGQAMRVDNVILNVTERHGSCSTISYVTLHGGLGVGHADSSMSVLLAPPRGEGESVDSYKKARLVECVGEMLKRAESEGYDGIVMRSDSVTRVYSGNHIYGNEYTLESVVNAKDKPLRGIDKDDVHDAIVAYNFSGKDHPYERADEPRKSGSVSVSSVGFDDDDDPFGVFGDNSVEDEIIAF